jgi:hypothetical protein
MTFVAAFLFSAHAATFTVTLAWDTYPAPSKISGFNVYEYDSIAQTYTFIVAVPSPTATTVTLPAVAIGTHTYVITAYGPTGESAYSNQATATVPSPPLAPTNLKATVSLVQ